MKVVAPKKASSYYYHAMKHVAVFLVVISSCQVFASNALERALRSTFVPSLRIQYTFANGFSHLFLASLRWDLDDSPAFERQLEGIKIERLQREAERISLGADKYLCSERGICDDKSE